MATLAISMAAFLTVAIPWTIVAWLDPQSMRKYKIQQKPFEFDRFFWPSVGRIIQNNIILAALLVLFWPLIKLSGVHDGALPAWYIIIIQLLFFVFLDDFLYYWMHRYMHENKWLLRHVHSVHHRIRNTCGINGNYMHWLEFSLTAFLTLVGPMLIGAHIYVIWIWVIIRQFEGADGHIGYDVPWNPAHLFPVYQGPVYHDFHHAKFKGNYAGFLPYLDKYLGQTHIAAYLRYLEERKKGLSPQQIADQPSAQRKRPTTAVSSAQ
ncbi:sterol desaturase family protein [Aestuariirhabdus sp. Z084]|uniref:sterol desaturase family protein n=1 Tax=Aestuariirhabdus haliotis TaxID=2918751 RepID=UPI00201B4357|nr:sterol desaturase family protein [Aestuariirhabdus haliotis]MCL6416945.1 sterol desaturase family protein [Aestuariirhabdus haliotis]MCL6420952.1 sterol desaturase family protein [Aestuariirhabdus haliotis]